MALVWGEGPVAFQQQQRHLSPRVVSIYSHDLYGPLQLKTIVYLNFPFSTHCSRAAETGKQMKRAAQTAVLVAVGMAAGYRLPLPHRLHLARTRKAAGCGYTRTKALFGRRHRITYIQNAGSFHTVVLYIFCPIVVLPKFLWWDLLSVPEHMIECKK